MGIWIEFRCDNAGAASAYGVAGQCLSHNNEGPSAMSGHTQAALLETMRKLEKTAKKTGWKKTRAGWQCPFCAARTGEQG